MTDSEETRWYSLRPVDAWFFRDGHQSNRDEDQSDLQSLFPPHSQTVVGAIRAAIAREMGWPGHGDWERNIKAVLGDGFHDLGRFRFVGPLLAIKDSPLFPLPMHVCGRKLPGEEYPQFEAKDWLLPSSNPICCDANPDKGIHLPVLAGTSDIEKGEKPFAHSDEFLITIDGMSKVLQGQLPAKDDCIHRDRLYAYEARVGIQRDPETRTTGEHAMYSPHYIRLHHDVSLLMGVVGPSDIALPAVFPLGGESRMATCAPVERTVQLPESVDGGDVICLVTPSYFDAGSDAAATHWYGAGPSDAAGQLHHDLSGTVRSVCLDRPTWIGGFDSRAGSKGPLPLRPHTSPGTVWWLNDGVPASNQIQFLGSNTAYGYGMAFVGKQGQDNTA